MYNINDTYSAVYEIQRYLSVIDRARGNPPCVVADGIYEERTRECVRRFQADNKLPETGIVDYDTFRQVYDEYLLALEILASPACVRLLPVKLEGQSITRGDESSTVAIIQSLLKTLEVVYDDFEAININGSFDDSTESAVKRIQYLHGLEQNGIIDRATFDAIAAEYEKFIKKDT